MRGSYNESEYSDFGKLNEKDGASIVASMATYQPLILSVSAAIEARALTIEETGELSALPGLGFATTFAGSWLIQTLIVGLLKMIACLLRDRGSSLMRDFAVWAWRWVFAHIWWQFTTAIGQWFSWVPKLPRFPRIRPSEPVDPVEPDAETDHPFIERIKRLRPRKRKQ